MAQPFEELDLTQLGAAVINAVAASALAGHADVASTLRDYATGVETAEARFLRDVMTKSIEDVTNEWFGGTVEAAVVAQDAIARSIDA